MFEAEKLVKDALVMIQGNPFLEQAKAFVKSHEDYWVHNEPTDSDLVCIDLSINFSTIGYKNKGSTEPWFKCTIGSTNNKHVDIRVFPDNSMMHISWWQKDEVVKCEMVNLNK